MKGLVICNTIPLMLAKSQLSLWHQSVWYAKEWHARYLGRALALGADSSSLDNSNFHYFAET